MSNRQQQIQQIGEFVLKQKEVSAETWNSFSPQTRVLTLFSVIMLIGLILYTISFGDPSIPMYIMITFAVAVLLMVRELPTTSSESRLAMLAGVVAGAGIWIMIFYRQAQEDSKNRDFGLLELMCKTTDSICPADGVRGPYNGLQPYIFQPLNKVDDSGVAVRYLNYVPPEFLRSDNPNSFSYCFWMRVSYQDWKRPDSIGKNKPVLLRTNTMSSDACPGIWLDPETNVVKIEANVAGQKTTIDLEYPMDLWVHYTIVLRSMTETTFEVYKNGKLVVTRILPATMPSVNTRLYVGTTPEENDGSTVRPPIQMVDLVYYNTVLTPEEIQNIYKTQRPTIIAMGPPPSSLSNQPVAPDPDSCRYSPKVALPSTTPDDKTSLADKTRAMFAKIGISLDDTSTGGGSGGIFSGLENKWSSMTSSGATGDGSGNSGNSGGGSDNNGGGGSSSITESFTVNGVDGSVIELFHSW